VQDSKTDNFQSQMRKGILEMCTLAILNKADAYSNEIIETLRKGNMIVVEGTLYPMLNRLKKMELLTYRWEESKSGPPRKYYSITSKGSEILSEMTANWKEMTESVNHIINT
jgi:PadR family transcriptional regulator PadR